MSTYFQDPPNYKAIEPPPREPMWVAPAVRRFMLEERGQFRPLQFEHLRMGDVFCAYEPDGAPVEYQGYTVFRATENAKPDGSIDMVTVR